MIAWVVPANYYVSSLQTLFLTGDVWPVLLPDLAALLAIALGFFVVMALTTRTRLD